MRFKLSCCSVSWLLKRFMKLNQNKCPKVKLKIREARQNRQQQLILSDIARKIRLRRHRLIYAWEEDHNQGVMSLSGCCHSLPLCSSLYHNASGRYQHLFYQTMMPMNRSQAALQVIIHKWKIIMHDKYTESNSTARIDMVECVFIIKISELYTLLTDLAKMFSYIFLSSKTANIWKTSTKQFPNTAPRPMIMSKMFIGNR